MADIPGPSKTIAEILDSSMGSRFYGDGPQHWWQGPTNKPSKTTEQAAREADHLAKALRRDGGADALELAEVMKRCTPRRPCLSGACPICQRAAQRLFVNASRNLYLDLGGDVLAVSVVWTRAAVADGALDSDDVFDRTRRRLNRALADCGVPAIGGFDVSLNEHQRGAFAPHCALHAWILVPGRTMRRVKERFRRWFSTNGATPHPVRIQRFDGRRRGLAYALKTDFSLRISLERRFLADGSRSTFSTRPKRIWGRRRVELALALDRAGLDARVFLRGFELVVRAGDIELARTRPAPPRRPLERSCSRSERRLVSRR